VSFEIHPVTPERWPDLVELFERRGVRGGRRNSPAYGCWCMYWRDRSLPHGEPKKRDMGHSELYRRGGFAHVRDVSKRAIVRVE